MKKNIMWKIISQSKLYATLDPEKLKEAADQCEFITFKKGETVFQKKSQHLSCIYVLLNTALSSPSGKYEPNSIIEIAQLLDKKNMTVKDDMVALDDGMMGKLKYTIE